MKKIVIMPPKPEVFTARMTVCRVCGRRLTSDLGLKNGMGNKCLRKWQRMNALPDTAQITFWEDTENAE